MRFLAPAKLNLFLHVNGRRPDGFHDLETVFQLIDLYDVVHLAVRTDGRILRQPPPGDAMLAALRDEDDLAVRAARLLQREAAVALGVNIHVEKRIPAGGGLGGGSSDAACVLRALNSLWGVNWPLDRLATLGLELGSDVPVFVYARNAFASGRGEQLTPIHLPLAWYLVVDPGVAVPTRELFGASELTRDTPRLTIRALPPDGGRNDFEPVVRKRYRGIAAVLEALAPHGPRLTGTGACVFARFATQGEAEVVAQDLPSTVRSWVVRGLDC